MHYPLQYRRARALVYAVLVFWLWAWLGSGYFITSLFGSPVYALLALYALAVAILVSFPIFLLAATRMLLNRPRRTTGVVTSLRTKRTSSLPPSPQSGSWISDKAS
ncbi:MULTISPECIES: hypothetical protein [unclassified Arthrobacter]|uniref:hypothetical protein n=1 Tax=unclassified Arthrobacter TaxID=235627 RepID=UPI0014928AE7|nr:MULTISPECIES: hypothetical protein [unclassified Arthrobacter]MBE0010010.1 hypothetical protein [Arthrobacter sp. AET 35A]NOJ58803.1 hypothetical protein [Arthrobacter sp. 260]NOJ63817.1 hypothetical protein [Arthrobacter sp. 147(2020)]